VDDNVPADQEHPTQGRSPDLKLVWQPPTQLPVMAFGSFASSRSAGEVGDADRVEVLGDVSEDTVLRATARGFGFSGLTICFGASTTTPGSEAVAPNEGVAVCDNKATARLAANSDEAFMAMSSQSWEGPSIPSRCAG
jgi:hypothetical protein